MDMLFYYPIADFPDMYVLYMYVYIYMYIEIQVTIKKRKKKRNWLKMEKRIQSH